MLVNASCYSDVQISIANKIERYLIKIADSLKASAGLDDKKAEKNYTYYSFKAAEKNGLKNISALPFSIKVLLENLIRNEDGATVELNDIKEFEKWKSDKKVNKEINFRPARVLMQDFTGVPAVVDLASMRSAIKNEKGDPKKVNPLSPVDLVIDHSVMVCLLYTSDAADDP